MAIAADVATASTVAFYPAQCSWDHTCSGSDRLLVVSAMGVASTSSNSPTLTVDAVYYNSVAMTPIVIASETPAVAAQTIQLWVMANPPAGTYTIDIASSHANTYATFGCACSYTGVNQTTPTGAYKTNFNGPTFSTYSITHSTAQDQSWAGLITKNNYGLASAGTATTERTSVHGGFGFFDSNGAISPAGSRTLEVTTAASTNWVGIWFEIKDATVGGGGTTWPGYQSPYGWR